MTAFMEWVTGNYGILAVAFIALLFIGHHYLKKYRLNKGKAKQAVNSGAYPQEEQYLQSTSTLLEPDLFEDIQSKDALGTFNKQKVNIERSLVQIKNEAKKIVGEERKLDFGYRQQKGQFTNDKQKLGLKYTGYMHQKRIIEEMIQNQAKMQEEFDKMKGN